MYLLINIHEYSLRCPNKAIKEAEDDDNIEDNEDLDPDKGKQPTVPDVLMSKHKKHAHRKQQVCIPLSFQMQNFAEMYLFLENLIVMV